MSPWTPSRIVTLTTDFGSTDTFVGIVKGVLHERCPGVACVDLTHAVEPQDVASAAFHLAHSWRWFPTGTVHVAVVDPGVGTARAIVVAQRDGHAFLAPDNGLLGPVLEGPPAAGPGATESEQESDVRALDVERFALPRRSRTFHGRDVFAPAAAAFAAGLDPREAGPPARISDPIVFPRPRRAADGLELEVLIVDRFGNLVTNYAPGPGEDLAAHVVEVGGRRVPVRGTYADAALGELLALVDSYGHLEIARRGGSAARELGLGRGSAATLRRLD